MAWKLISLSLWKIRCKWEDYHHYGVISHEMVASLLVLFMRCASLFLPANVLRWPLGGQRGRRLSQKELGLLRQVFFPLAWQEEVLPKKRRVQPAPSKVPLGIFPGTSFEASRTLLPSSSLPRPHVPPLNLTRPLS